MWFTQISLKNPVLATMMMLAFVVLGAFSLQNLQIDQFPNVDYPYVIVTTQYPGASPAVVESEVTQKIEEAVNSVAGIKSLTSRSYEGLSQVVIEFQLQVDERKAADDVREKVAQVRPWLRNEVKDSFVERFDPGSHPIWSVAVMPDVSARNARPMSPTAITDWADQVLKKRLENARGVGAVNLVGGAQREIHIDLIPAQLTAYGITPGEVLAAVQGENQNPPLGNVHSQERDLAVQMVGRMTRPEDFGGIIVAQRGGPNRTSPVYLDQVADVKDTAPELNSLALYNNQRTVLLSVQKAQDENTIDVIDGLDKTIRAIAPEVPPGLRLEVVNDDSRPIRMAVHNVRETLVDGALLTVLIVFLFLNSWRSTVITALTLPVSVIGAFFFMLLLGFTINLVTLMALSLSIGFLIDDAIVVRENIVRHLQMGKSPYAAALDGTREIGLAVLATTLSIVAVFLPIGFMQGVIGRFFHQFGITIVAAVLISMFVSFTLDPMLSSVWHDPAIHALDQSGAARSSLYDRTLGRITNAFERATSQLGLAYQRILRWALAHRLTTVAVAAAIFVGSLLMLPLLGSEFIPTADLSEINFAFYTPPGTSLDATEAKARQAIDIIHSYPEVRYTLTTIGSGTARGENGVAVYVRLLDRSQRHRSAEQLSAQLRRRLLAVPGITVTQAGLLDPVGDQKPIEFSLQGPDQAGLDRIARPLLERLRAVPGLVDLDSSARPDRPAIEVAMKRDAASNLGLSLAQVATPLRTMIAGETAGNWRAPDGQTYDVIVQLAPEARNSQGLAYLPLMVTGTNGQPSAVNLNQVATLSEGFETDQLNRRSMTREVLISANAYGRSTGEVLGDIQTILDHTPLPPGYRYEFTGSTENMQESFHYAMQAIMLAIIFIYMILASQFRSFVQPLSLMTSLPLTLIGVVLALMAFGTPVSIFSLIGIVMLMGLVTKNAILLVDFANRARAGHIDESGEVTVEPLPRDEALLAAAQVRLRPILMTTLAMVFGMLPLAFATSEGAEQRAPLGQAVIGGVITSSLLTLVVVPVVYGYLDDFVVWFKRRRGADHRPDEGNH